MINLTINTNRHLKKPTIPESISTDKLTIVSEITYTPNLRSVLSIDLNISKGEADELATDYLQMIRKNDQVKDKYKVRIDKGENFQNNLTHITFTDEA